MTEWEEQSIGEITAQIQRTTARDIADWLEYRYHNGDFNKQNLKIAKMIRENYHIEVDE